jgi:hypothetical protein
VVTLGAGWVEAGRVELGRVVDGAMATTVVGALVGTVAADEALAAGSSGVAALVLPTTSWGRSTGPEASVVAPAAGAGPGASTTSGDRGDPPASTAGPSDELGVAGGTVVVVVTTVVTGVGGSVETAPGSDVDVDDTASSTALVPVASVDVPCRTWALT